MSQHDGRMASEPTKGPQGEPVSQTQASSLGSTEALPETYGVDEVGVLPKDPWWYFVYWEVTEAGLESARDQLAASDEQARLVLRVLSSAGERRGRDSRDIRDIPVEMTARHGRRYLEAPRANAVFRVAIGLLSPEGLFAPIAHSPMVRMPPQQASGDTSIEWLHVLPSRGDGRQRERIVTASQEHSERMAAPRPSAADGHGKGHGGLGGLRELGGASDLRPTLSPDGKLGQESSPKPGASLTDPPTQRGG